VSEERGKAKRIRSKIKRKTFTYAKKKPPYSKEQLLKEGQNTLVMSRVVASNFLLLSTPPKVSEYFVYLRKPAPQNRFIISIAVVTQAERHDLTHLIELLRRFYTYNIHTSSCSYIDLLISSL
jgi:hypothetical protein